MNKKIAAVVLVAVGVFFLLTNLGLLQVSLMDLLSTWWPVALIGVGLFLLLSKDKSGKAGAKMDTKAPPQAASRVEVKTDPKAKK